MELNNEGKFKAEGNFKPVHLQALEKKLHEKLPNCDKLAKPHIESRLRTLKTNFQTVHEMLTGLFCSGFGWDLDRKTVTAEKPIWDEYLKSHNDATPFKTKAFPYYEELCMVYGKDRATGKNAEDPADVVEQLDKEGGDDVNLDEDAFDTSNMMGTDEAQSMSFSEAGKRHQLQSSGSTKKKKKSTDCGHVYEALKESSSVLASAIEKASTRLSLAIGEDITEKHMRLREELEKTTMLTTLERHKAARMIMQDNGLMSYFFSLPEDGKDEWVRALLTGAI